MEYNPALDVFGKRKIDSSVDSVTYAEIKCQQAIDQKGPYIFRNDGCQHPILLRDVMLKMKCKLVKSVADGAIAAAETCGTVNYPLAAMFSRVDLTLAGKSVGFTHSLYPFQAMIQELLYADSAEEDSRLIMEGFIKDTAGLQLVVDPEDDAANDGLVARRDKLFALSKPAVLMGRPHLDLFRQNRCLLAGIPFELTLHKNDDKFVIIKKAGGAEFKLKILDLTLMVPVVKPTEAMRRGLESVIQKNHPAVYNIDRTEMLAHFIPTGVSSHSIPSLYRGKLPHTIVFAMAANADRANDTGKNPFVFQGFGLKRLVLLKNNEPVGYQNGLTTDYSEGKGYTEGYYNYLKNTGRLEGSSGGQKPLITYEEFRAGYCLYPFRLCPPSGVDTDTSTLNTGTLSVLLEFTAATTAALDLFVYSEFSDSILVDKDLNVRTGDVPI